MSPACHCKTKSNLLPIWEKLEGQGPALAISRACADAASVMHLAHEQGWRRVLNGTVPTLAHKDTKASAHVHPCTLTVHKTCLKPACVMRIYLGELLSEGCPTFPHGALDIPHDETVLVVQELYAYLCDLHRSHISSCQVHLVPLS